MYLKEASSFDWLMLDEPKTEPVSPVTPQREEVAM